MFSYYGRIKQLERELDRVRPQLEAVYQHVWGPLFPIIKEVEEKYITRESFNLLGQVEGLDKPEIRSVANRFTVATGIKGKLTFDNMGGFAPVTLYQAPGFQFTREAFNRSAERYKGWISPYLGPYIHEYDHFATWAVQSHPMAAAMQLIAIGTGINHHPFELGDVPDLVLSRDGGQQERLLTAYLGIWFPVINSSQEFSNRVIDHEVFRLMGYTVPSSETDIPEKRWGFVPIPIRADADPAMLGDFHELVKKEPADRSRIMEDAGTLLAVVAMGDGMKRFSLRERIWRLSEWIDRITPMHPVQANFMQSLKACTVEKLSLVDLIAKEKNMEED